MLRGKETKMITSTPTTAAPKTAWMTVPRRMRRYCPAPVFCPAKVVEAWPKAMMGR